MEQVTFTLRTLTPLFLAGADQTAAELRPPTIRGLMRYWYRALVAGQTGASENTLQLIKAAETSVFGATDTGSAISIRLSRASKIPQHFQKESLSRVNMSGKDYLLWSMAANRSKPERLYFPPDTTFQVTLSNKGGNTPALQQAIAAFWLLTHLGGIGSRSRRCAGSFIVQANDGNTHGFQFDIPGHAKNLQNHIYNGINLAQQVIQQNLDSNLSNTMIQASFDALGQHTCKIWILPDRNQIWHSSDNAMRAIGSSLQAYRNSLPLHARTVFGLPLLNVDSQSRRASPLLLRITELQDGEYVGIVLLFKTGIHQNYDVIENWITKDFPQALEVLL